MILYHIKENMPLTRKEKIFLQIGGAVISNNF